jgi:hypothetical protein
LTGSKTQLENDYQAPSNGGIALTRYYNSFARQHSQDFNGQKWRHNFNSVLLNSSVASHSQGVHDQVSNDPGSQSFSSSAYSSQSAACLSGFAEIKGTVWGGKLSGASAEYLVSDRKSEIWRQVAKKSPRLETTQFKMRSFFDPRPNTQPT